MESTLMTAPLAARTLRCGIDWLRAATRYRVAIPLVPNGDEERRVATVEAYGLGLRPAERLSAIEYEHAGIYDCRDDPTRCLSTRRIALTVDMDSVCAVSVDRLPGFERSPDDAGALLVWPLTYYDEKNEWAFAPGAAIVPRYQALGTLDQVERPVREWRRRGRQLLRMASLPAVPMLVHYQEMLPELITKLGPDQAALAIRESALDATWVALGLFAALRCRNVELMTDEHGQRGARWRAKQEDAGGGYSLDPFHGAVTSDWLGRPRWQQGVHQATGLR